MPVPSRPGGAVVSAGAVGDDEPHGAGRARKAMGSSACDGGREFSRLLAASHDTINWHWIFLVNVRSVSSCPPRRFAGAHAPEDQTADVAGAVRVVVPIYVYGNSDTGGDGRQFGSRSRGGAARLFTH